MRREKYLGDGKMIKKTGYGSLSIVFFILAFLSSVTIARTFCFGDILLRAFGISPWSSGYSHSGFHNTVYLTIGFLVLGLVVGKVFNKDWGAKSSWKVCAFFLLVFFLLFLLVFPVVKGVQG